MTNTSLREGGFDFSRPLYIESPATPEQQAIRDVAYLKKLVEAVATSHKAVNFPELLLTALQRPKTNEATEPTITRPLAQEEIAQVLEVWQKIKAEGFSLDEYNQK